MSEREVFRHICNILRSKGYTVQTAQVPKKPEFTKTRCVRADNGFKFTVTCEFKGGDFESISVDRLAKQYLLNLCQENGIYYKF